MRDTKAALIWITSLLRELHIPFQITGGLAAIVYGAKRELEDIDIDVPEDKFEIISDKVKNYITYGPNRFKSDKWDLYLMTLNYHGQEIDLGGALETKIFNDATQEWEMLHTDFATAIEKEVMGVKVPVIQRDELLAYKKVLAREVDLIDVEQIEKGEALQG